MELLECKHLYKSYDDTPVLKDINLKIGRGKIIGLLGKNGVGKSTLIKIINDLLVPTEGEVYINGEKPGVNSKKTIAYLPERTYLDKEMKITEVFHYFEEFYDNFNIEKAKKLLKDLNLDMSRDVDLYILDEPLGGVDPATRDYILDTILSNFKEGASMIISTHLISDIERILDEVIFMNDGKIILTSPADELREKEKSSIDEIFRRYFKC